MPCTVISLYLTSFAAGGVASPTTYSRRWIVCRSGGCFEASPRGGGLAIHSACNCRGTVASFLWICGDAEELVLCSCKAVGGRSSDCELSSPCRGHKSSSSTDSRVTHNIACSATRSVDGNVRAPSSSQGQPAPGLGRDRGNLRAASLKSQSVVRAGPTPGLLPAYPDSRLSGRAQGC